MIPIRLSSLHHWIFWLVAVLPMTTIAVYWHANHPFYPRPDEGGYFSITQSAWLQFKVHGLWSALTAAYSEREMRQLLHSALGLPALIIFDGKVRAAMGAHLTLLYLVAQTYIFFFLRVRGTALGAIGGCWLLASSWWFFDRAGYYSAEISLFCCLAASAYHFVRSSNLTIQKHAILLGVWLGLGLCMRPAEMATLAGVYLVFWIIKARNVGLIRYRDLMVPIGMLVLLGPFSVFMLSQPPHRPARSAELACMFGVLMAGAGGPLLLSKRLMLSRGFTTLVTTTFAVIVLWYGPYIDKLLHWIYSCTFGDLARVANPNAKEESFEYLKNIFKNFVYPAHLIPLVTALPVLFQSRGKRVRVNGHFALAFVTMWALLLFLGVTSHNRDTRYYMAPMFVSLLLVLKLSVERHAWLPRLRAGAVSVVGLFGVLTIFYPVVLGKSWSWGMYGSHFPARTNGQYVDPVVKVVEKLKEFIPRSSAEEPPVRIAMSHLKRYRLDEPALHPEPLTIRAREQGLNWFFYDIGFGEKVANEHALVDKAALESSYYLIGPAGGLPRPPIPEWGSASVAKAAGTIIQNTLSAQVPEGLLFLGRVPYHEMYGYRQDEMFLYASGYPTRPPLDNVSPRIGSAPDHFPNLKLWLGPDLASSLRHEPKFETSLGYTSALSAFVVARIEPDDEKLEIFGWNNCLDDKVALYATPKRELLLSFPKTEISFDREAKVPLYTPGKTHIVSVVTSENWASVSVDGVTSEGTLPTSLRPSRESRFFLGNSGCGPGFKGEIAEAILYSQALMPVDRRQIERYLAKKHGISLKL